MKKPLIYVFISLLIFSTYELTLNPVTRKSYQSISQNSIESSIIGCVRKLIPKEQQDHQLTPPIIISPSDDEILNGMVNIEWIEANDSLGYDVRYTVYESQYGYEWNVLESNIATNYYNWSTKNTRDGNYYIKVKAECSDGLFSESRPISITIQNIQTPEIKLALTLFLFLIITFILISAILCRKRINATKSTVKLKNFRDIMIGLSFGSFTDYGLVTKYRNDNCPFSLQQIQSLLEYSAVLYHHGKTETIYGPIPLTRVKEVQQFVEQPQNVNEWNFISYWMNIRDESVEDLRISKIGGMVPAALLLFYPKQLDQLILVKKDLIHGFFRSVIGENTDITDITNETLNQIENQLIKLLMKNI
ncbi:MAG: hypothetical protein ACFFFH_12100 [Candidatus Thorarchaeota archaeon]